MTKDRRRASMYRAHLLHRHYADGGNAAPVPVAGLTLYAAASGFGRRTWATYADAHRRAESIRDAYRATGRGAAFPTAPRGGVA